MIVLCLSANLHFLVYIMFVYVLLGFLTYVNKEHSRKPYNPIIIVSTSKQNSQ